MQEAKQPATFKLTKVLSLACGTPARSGSCFLLATHVAALRASGVAFSIPYSPVCLSRRTNALSGQPAGPARQRHPASQRVTIFCKLHLRLCKIQKVAGRCSRDGAGSPTLEGFSKLLVTRAVALWLCGSAEVRNQRMACVH